jgi:hypothetical protein
MSTTDIEPAVAQTARPTRPVGTDWATDLGWRAVLVVVAAVLGALSAPPALTTVVTAAAAVAVIDRVVRYRRRGMLDAALVGSGALVVVPGLIGLLLNYVPGGITATSWGVALVLVGIGSLTLAGLARGPVPPSPFRPLLGRRSIPTAAWSLAAVAVLTLALLLSVGSFHRTHVAPVDIAGTAVRNGSATVTLSAGSAQGPFELDLVTTSGRVAVARNITVTPDTSVAVVVAVPAGSRVLVQLVKPGTTTPLRQLTFDSSSTGTGR